MHTWSCVTFLEALANGLFYERPQNPFMFLQGCIDRVVENERAGKYFSRPSFSPPSFLRRRCNGPCAGGTGAPRHHPREDVVCSPLLVLRCAPYLLDRCASARLDGPCKRNPAEVGHLCQQERSRWRSGGRRGFHRRPQRLVNHDGYNVWDVLHQRNLFRDCRNRSGRVRYVWLAHRYLFLFFFPPFSFLLFVFGSVCGFPRLAPVSWRLLLLANVATKQLFVSFLRSCSGFRKLRPRNSSTSMPTDPCNLHAGDNLMQRSPTEPHTPARQGRSERKNAETGKTREEEEEAAVKATVLRWRLVLRR